MKRELERLKYESTLELNLHINTIKQNFTQLNEKYEASRRNIINEYNIDRQTSMKHVNLQCDINCEVDRRQVKSRDMYTQCKVDVDKSVKDEESSNRVIFKEHENNYRACLRSIEIHLKNLKHDTFKEEFNYILKNYAKMEAYSSKNSFKMIVKSVLQAVTISYRLVDEIDNKMKLMLQLMNSRC